MKVAIAEKLQVWWYVGVLWRRILALAIRYNNVRAVLRMAARLVGDFECERYTESLGQHGLFELRHVQFPDFSSRGSPLKFTAPYSTYYYTTNLSGDGL